MQTFINKLAIKFISLLFIVLFCASFAFTLLALVAPFFGENYDFWWCLIPGIPGTIIYFVTMVSYCAADDDIRNDDDQEYTLANVLQHFPKVLKNALAS